MSEEMRYGLVTLRLECLIDKSNEKGKVWAKPIRGRSYLIDEERVQFAKEE